MNHLYRVHGYTVSVRALIVTIVVQKQLYWSIDCVCSFTGRGSPHHLLIRKPETTTETATRTPPNKRFNYQSNGCERAMYVFINFATVLCKKSSTYFEEREPRRLFVFSSGCNLSLSRVLDRSAKGTVPYNCKIQR